MSLPVYRRANRTVKPPTESKYASYWKNAEKSKRNFPTNLAFEEIVGDKASSVSICWVPSIECSVDEANRYHSHVPWVTSWIIWYTWSVTQRISNFSFGTATMLRDGVSCRRGRKNGLRFGLLARGHTIDPIRNPLN